MTTKEAIQEAVRRFEERFVDTKNGIMLLNTRDMPDVKSFLSAELSRIVALRDGEICKALEMMKNRWHWEEAYGLDKSMFYICSKCTYIQNSPEGHNCEIEDSILSQAQEIIRQLK